MQTTPTLPPPLQHHLRPIKTTTVYALDLVGEIANIRLGPFNTDPAALSLVEHIWFPDEILIRINVS